MHSHPLSVLLPRITSVVIFMGRFSLVHTGTVIAVWFTPREHDA
jgi:hypothetical protein